MRATIVIALLAGLLSPSVTERSTPHTLLHADRVLVLKKQRTLELLSQSRVIKTFKVALGGDPSGPKTRQGDHKTPEGVYVLNFRNAHSPSYKSLHNTYPTDHDRLLAR